MRKRVFNIRNDFTIKNNFKNCIIYDLNNNTVIYKKNENEICNIASLTKLMTAILLEESKIKLNDKIVVKPEIIESVLRGFSVAGFKGNEIITKKDLLHGILLPSGADACKITADLLGGRPDFVKKMNKKAKEIGLKHTHYNTEIGGDQVGNYSTANDLAKILKYMLKNKILSKILYTMKYETTNGHTLKHTLLDYSEKFKNDKKYLTAGKSGSTSKAGLCLVLVSEKDDKKLLFVGLGVPIRRRKCSDHMIQANMIFDHIYRNYDYKMVVSKDEVFYSVKPKFCLFKINFKLKDDFKMLLPKQTDKITFKFKAKESFKWKPNCILGKFNIIKDDVIISTKSVKIGKKKFLEYLFKITFPIILVFVVSIIIIIL